MVEPNLFFRPLQVQSWPKNIVCFTTSVHGGSSQPPYASFNLGNHVGDDPQHVSENRNLLKEYLASCSQHSVADIKWLNQQHTSQALDFHDVNFEPCDAIFTQHSNTPLAIMTADCLPVVMHCSSSNAIVAIHAGWRGLLSGIIEKTLAKISHATNDFSNIKVWIGPSISPNAFEVSHDVIDQFSHYSKYIKKLPKQKYQVDLPQIAQQILSNNGITDIQISPICSYASEHCFSHRRAMHQGLSNTGRMASVIMRLY